MENNEYKLTILIRNDNTSTIVCSCGYNGAADEQGLVRTCPKCERFIDKRLESTKGTFTLANFVECDEKSDKHFKATKCKVVATINNGTVKFQKKEIAHVHFDMVKKRFYAFKKTRKEELPISLKAFFNGVSEEEFIMAVGTDNSQRFMRQAKRKYGKQNYEANRILWRGIERSLRATDFERAYSAGFKDIFFRDDIYLPSGNLYATTLHESLGIPKYAIRFIKDEERVSADTLRGIKSFSEYVDGNNLKYILEMLYENGSMSSVNNINILVRGLLEYDYNDYKRLMQYTIRDCKLEQGITNPIEAFQLLRDYVRMSVEMGIEYEKYPKSLKKSHDIATMNFNVVKSKFDRENFKNAVQEYQDLAYKTKTYSIIAPEEPKDLVTEGSMLNHCVSSYVKDVISKRCCILFMRDSSNTDNPLITIEVRDKIIRQAKGTNNRKPIIKEDEFIKEWAKEKELQYALY